MNKSLSYVNLSLELHVLSPFWLGSDTSDTFSLYFAQPSYELLERPALRMHILWCRTDICSDKRSAKVSLVLDKFHLFVNWTISAFVSSRLIRKSTSNNLFPSRKAMFFLIDPRCFGPLGKFQHNLKISIKTAHVSRLSVSLWLWFNVWLY